MNSYSHLSALGRALAALQDDVPQLEAWGAEIAGVAERGGRVLAVGNGGSAAHAQHLTAELVGRYVEERPPISAIALHADTSALTALTNDYGIDEMFARAVAAHGRPGDVLVALSTSGRSANVVRAVEVARDHDMIVLALTGPAPNPLTSLATASVSVNSGTPTVQEIHQVAIHLVCAAVDASLATRRSSPTGVGARSR